jgi:hypothetical protein
MLNLIRKSGSWNQYLLWSFWNVLGCQRSYMPRTIRDESWVCETTLLFQSYWSVNYCLGMVHRGVLKTLSLLLFFWYFFGYDKIIVIFLFTLLGDQHKMPLVNYFTWLFGCWSGSWWFPLKFWLFDSALIWIFSTLVLMGFEIES